MHFFGILGKCERWECRGFCWMGLL